MAALAGGVSTAGDPSRLRWAVDVRHPLTMGADGSGHSDPDSDERRLLSLLPEPERAAVLRFVQPLDRRRALASRLLQRAAVSRALGVPWREVAISRTRGGKPFTTNVKPDSCPNFNYNVAHEVRGLRPPPPGTSHPHPPLTHRPATVSLPTFPLPGPRGNTSLTDVEANVKAVFAVCQCGNAAVRPTQPPPSALSAPPPARGLPCVPARVQGDYVVLASEPFHVVGVDVAAPRRCRPGGEAKPLLSYLQAFRTQLADDEVWCVHNSSPYGCACAICSQPCRLRPLTTPLGPPSLWPRAPHPAPRPALHAGLRWHCSGSPSSSTSRLRARQARPLRSCASSAHGASRRWAGGRAGG